MKTSTNAAVSTAERRSGRDRRRQDIAPPAGRDRRRSVEPRKPEVAELEMTASQWDALHEDAFPTLTAVPPIKP